MLILKERMVHYTKKKKNKYVKPKNLSFLLCIAILTFHLWSLKPNSLIHSNSDSLHFISLFAQNIVEQAKIEGQVYGLKPTAIKYLLTHGN